MVQEWNLIALAIARSTGRRIGIDTSTRMAMNAVFAPDREPAHKGRLRPEPDASDELTRILTKKPFWIQSIGTTPDSEQPILKEVEIQVSDASSAIVFAAKLAWPPRRPGCESSIVKAARSLSDTRPIADRHRHQGANDKGPLGFGCYFWTI